MWNSSRTVFYDSPASESDRQTRRSQYSPSNSSRRYAIVGPPVNSHPVVLLRRLGVDGVSDSFTSFAVAATDSANSQLQRFRSHMSRAVSSCLSRGVAAISFRKVRDDSDFDPVHATRLLATAEVILPKIRLPLRSSPVRVTIGQGEHREHAEGTHGAAPFGAGLSLRGTAADLQGFGNTIVRCVVIGLCHPSLPPCTGG